MKWIDQTQLEIDPDESDLLVWSIPNEVINGFKVDRFQDRIGESEEQFKSASNRLRSLSKTRGPVMLSAHEVEIFRNALALTLEELGVDEFSTRTGHEFDKGQLVLRGLDDFLRGEDLYSRG
jgi:hypothetical protein